MNKMLNDTLFHSIFISVFRKKITFFNLGHVHPPIPVISVGSRVLNNFPVTVKCHLWGVRKVFFTQRLISIIGSPFDEYDVYVKLITHGPVQSFLKSLQGSTMPSDDRPLGQKRILTYNKSITLPVSTATRLWFEHLRHVYF